MVAQAGDVQNVGHLPPLVVAHSQGEGRRLFAHRHLTDVGPKLLLTRGS